MKKHIIYSSIIVLLVFVIIVTFYILFNLEDIFQNRLTSKATSLNEKIENLKEIKTISENNNEDSTIIIASYDPISKDFPLQTKPLADNFCVSKKIFKIETRNTQDELKTFNIKINTWQYLFEDYSDEIIILNLIELTLLQEKISKKIDLLYNCNLREEIKLDTRINKPYNNFKNNIQKLTQIITKRFPNINEILLETIQDPNTNIILLERIINSDFWKNNSKETNQIWIAANSVFEDENIKKCEYCDQIDFGKYHALLIGIDVYEFNQNLDTPVNDVRTLERILKNKYKFDTLTMLVGKLSRNEILDKLYNFRSTLTENDNLLVYFGGHGWRDPKTNRGYWLASESDNDKPFTMISSDDVSEVIKGLNAKQVLVISDSCYSAYMKDKSAVDSYENFSLEGLQSRSQDKARRLISSGKDMPVPDSINNSKNSLFASILFDELLSVENVLFAYDLWSKINKRLSFSEFEQEPVYGDIGNFNIEFNGDFIFVPKNN